MSRAEPIDHPLVRKRIDWARCGRAEYRVIAGRNHDLRYTLWRYSRVVERQRRFVRDRRDALASGVATSRWASTRPERHAELMRLVGEERAHQIERLLTLRALGDRWTELLGVLAALRESLQIVRLGQLDPLQEFGKEARAPGHRSPVRTVGCRSAAP